MMDNMLQKIIDFIKKETVLTIATVLAVVSAFWVHPGRQYVGYIDWRVLGILLSLMLIVAGFQSNGLFDAIGSRLLAKTKNTAQLMLVLVFLCFFSSMFITNDVALLTFVPFACTILQKCHQERLIVTAFVLQTLAANLGSMLTPVGNPQNLYLYSISGAGLGEFVGWMAPYTLVSGVLLLLVVFVLSAGKRRIALETGSFLQASGASGRKKNGIYLALFVLSLLSVARVLPWELMLAVVLIVLIFTDRAVFLQVDYCLLFTFISFFIFIGNMGNIEAVRSVLQSLVAGRELAVGIGASQIISNVPATLLLADFTQDIKNLTIGVNLGGLGTLIASMASLISYKIYAHNYNKTKGRYLLWFTIANVLFLAVLVLIYVFIHRKWQKTGWEK